MSLLKFTRRIDKGGDACSRFGRLRPLVPHVAQGSAFRPQPAPKGSTIWLLARRRRIKRALIKL